MNESIRLNTINLLSTESVPARMLSCLACFAYFHRTVRVLVLWEGETDRLKKMMMREYLKNSAGMMEGIHE